MSVNEFKAYLEGMGVYTEDSCPAPTQDQWDLICNKIDFLKEGVKLVSSDPVHRTYKL